MDTLHSIFPFRREWPPAIDDVAKAPPDAVDLRLVSGARNIAKLPSFKNLKSLWCFDIDGAKLRSICDCASLESLYIDNVKTANISGLNKLANLGVLGLEACFKAVSLEDLSELKSLSGLAVIHFKNVRDLGPLAKLDSLRALAVAGSVWTRMRVASFDPLGQLGGLELLNLVNTKAEDESLRPLGGLRKLKRLDIANFYPTSEFAWLSRRLPTTECAWFRPFVEMKRSECKKCGRDAMVLLTGKRKPMLCRFCDKTALEKHVLEWNKLTRE